MASSVGSLLDTDLYKLTMQAAVLHCYPKTEVTYQFTNRTPELKLNKKAFQWLEHRVALLSELHLHTEELAYLKANCPYFDAKYLEYLTSFRFKPVEHVRLNFSAIDSSSSDSSGSLSIEIQGLWCDTILYEVPLLALVSEAYFLFVDRDWNHEKQTERAYDKAIRLIQAGCVFSEFGTRRRRDYKTQDLVMQGLVQGSKDVSSTATGKLAGTSNVHFAMKYGISPVGTVAHEWFMGIAAITQDYKAANETALRQWMNYFGEGVLGIALTDTFGTPTFLETFQRPVLVDPTSQETSNTTNGKSKTFAESFSGLRQDSGDPYLFIQRVQKFYHENQISDAKTIVFSDALNVQKCIDLKKAAEEAQLVPTFGIGTYLTNDFAMLSKSEPSQPLNIVIKLVSAGNHPAIKISDNISKNSGEEETIEKAKSLFGYSEETWAPGDESRRWKV